MLYGSNFPSNLESASLLRELRADIKPSLECPPKWRVLVDIMKELQAECAKLDAVDSFRRRVMLIAKDARTISQLRDVMMFGDSFVMDQRYRWFISQQAASIVSVASRARCMSIRNTRGGNSRQAKRSREHPTGTAVDPDIQQLSESNSEWDVDTLLPNAPPTGDPSSTAMSFIGIKCSNVNNLLLCSFRRFISADQKFWTNR